MRHYKLPLEPPPTLPLIYKLQYPQPQATVSSIDKLPYLPSIHKLPYLSLRRHKLPPTSSYRTLNPKLPYPFLVTVPWPDSRREPSSVAYACPQTPPSGRRPVPAPRRTLRVNEGAGSWWASGNIGTFNLWSQYQIQESINCTLNKIGHNFNSGRHDESE